MKKILSIIALGGLLLVSHLKAQVVLEALEAPNDKCLERVYDKYYGDGLHNYIYCAVQGPNGKKWLNLNLGAEYAKESSPHFNPEAVPTDYNDWKAFGNLYQWGRDSDGHELVVYRQGSEYWEFRPINGVRMTLVGPGETSNQMVSVAGTQYYASYDLGDTWLNDPCPAGYRVMKSSDVTALGRLDSIVGLRYTASIFGNTESYPNLKLMTSPYVKVQPKIVGWQTTATALTGNVAGGSSQLWTADKSSRHYYYRASTGRWEIENYNNHELKSIDYYVIARGSSYEFGVVNFAYTSDPPSAIALRCVQK